MATSTVGLKEFDCKNKTHVRWLQKFTDFLNKMGYAENPTGHAAQLRTLLANNPLGVTIPLEAFIDTHAGISIKYAGNVLNGSAWIP